MNLAEVLADCSAAAVRAAHRANNEAIIRVRGGSMLPLLPDGTLLRLRPVDDDTLRAGEIVAVEDGPRLIVHRVVAIDASTVYTHGDRTSAPDAPFPRGAVVGVATHFRGPFGIWLPAAHGERIGSIARRLGRGMRKLAGLRKTIRTWRLTA